MNRDPTGYDCTRDPIYLVQDRMYTVNELPEWFTTDGDGYIVRDDIPSDIADDLVASGVLGWMEDQLVIISDRSFLKYLSHCEASSGYGYMANEWWHTTSVMLTRPEAEQYAKATAHNRPYGWRVYCIPCDGELARLLNELEPATR